MPDNRREWNPELPDWGRQEQPEPRYDFSNIKTTRNRPYDADSIAYIYRKFKDYGLDDLRASALLGTIIEESGGNPYAVSPDGKYQGLMQWEDSRYRINPFMEENRQREMDRQLDYIFRTMGNTSDHMSWTHGGKGSGYAHNTDAYDEFANSQDLGRIVHAWNRGYVRPTGKDDSVANRYNVAQQVYDALQNPIVTKPPMKYAEGGDIHIKESHKGRLTELIDRTGHSASWFKENGTPAQRKMATFALNARKWNKKESGGLLLNYQDYLK